MPLCSAVKSNQLKEIQKLLDKISRLIRKFPRGSRNERLKRAGRMLSQVEQIARTISLFHDGNITHQINDGDIGIWTIRNRGHHKRFNLGSNWTRLDVDSVTVGVTDSPLVGFLEYHSLSPLLEKARVLGSDLDPNKTVLISPVVSVFFDREDTDHLNEPISIRLQHSQINTTVYPNMTQCVFWSDNETAWSTAGCIKTHSTANETICNCTHLTSFAILVALNDDENLIASWPLTLITQIGLAISLLCLSLSIITFVFCRSIQGTRTTIHTFLCASLFLGHVIFLLGIKAHYNEVACSVVAGFLHLFYLSAFCWMFLEGLELYFMLVKVFNTHLKKRYLLMIGYGVPAAIVIISASVFPGGYGTSRHCWLSLKRNFIWSFMGPVCLILLVNCGIFVLTVWKLTEKMSQINPDLGKYKRIRSTTVAAVAQLCILGLSWIFGFLQFGSSSLFFAYAFSILNTLQGLQIFIFHCLMNKKVRADYARWICAVAHFKAPSYSEFNSTSQTQIRVREKSTNCSSNSSQINPGKLSDKDISLLQSKPPNKDSTL
ncbi:hypothetical protein GDO86_006849 [Hymenochirus boettgeri]|uniref:Uncharacterized protein n=1 Tax=Hymenochirus boettgeri TaxID=247094 RepID=A0A8T2JD88_9PIPI|nr:hypothetical protein GDO86_006849 [Hymenochirus boettgeri]